MGSSSLVRGESFPPWKLVQPRKKTQGSQGSEESNFRSNAKLSSAKYEAIEEIWETVRKNDTEFQEIINK